MTIKLQSTHEIGFINVLLAAYMKCWLQVILLLPQIYQLRAKDLSVQPTHVILREVIDFYWFSNSSSFFLL